MDGRRIARLRVTPVPPAPSPAAPPGGSPPAPPAGSPPPTPAPRAAADSQAPIDSPLHWEVPRQKAVNVPGTGTFDTVLVVDFGAQYAQLIARRVRECHVYSEIVPSTMPVSEMLAKRPKAIILSGGPSSVYADGAPPAPAGLFDAGVPVLGICYGFQLMVAGLGGTVERTGAAGYGRGVLIRGDGLIRGDDPPQTPPEHGGGPSPPYPPGPPAGGGFVAGTPPPPLVWVSPGGTAPPAPP